jgi:hypothetical protein
VHAHHLQRDALRAHVSGGNLIRLDHAAGSSSRRGEAGSPTGDSGRIVEGIERLRAAGSKLTGRAEAIVVIEVRHAAPLVSPAYDDGTATEADILEVHRARFARLHEHR